MFYVSYIEEYPIYEPAEGGYYYAGEHVVECREFSSWKKANRYFQEWRKWFLEEYRERACDCPCGGCGKYVNPSVVYFSRYIGEGARVELTRKKPVDRGRQPYC